MGIITLQDYNTLIVIDSLKIDDVLLVQILENNSFSNTEFDGKYFIKEIFYNKQQKKALIKVKISKDNSTNLISNFNQTNFSTYGYLRKLEKKIYTIIEDEKKKTHIHSIVKKGKPKIAQKFGEEAVELVIESGKNQDDKFIDEAADVFYYFLILLHERGFNISDVLIQLKKQKRKN